MTNLLVPTGLSKLRQLMSKANSSTLNLSLGKPFIDTPKEIKDLIPSILDKNLDYSENAGTMTLRSALSLRLGGTPQDYIVTNGAQGALFCTLMALINKDDEVLVPDPGFLAYPTMVEMLGGKVKTYPLKFNQSVFEYDEKSILDSVTAQTKTVLLTNPNNPTGSLMTDEGIVSLSQKLKMKNILLVIDEVYGELKFKLTYRPHFLLSDNIITLNSLSKSHAMTGWRLGFAATKNEIVRNKILVVHQYTATCAPRIAQNLAEKIYFNEKLYHETTFYFRQAYEQNFVLAQSILNYKFASPEASFYLFYPLASGADDETYALKLLQEKNVLVTPGSYFGKEGRGFVRLALSLPKDSLEQALKLMI